MRTISAVVVLNLLNLALPYAIAGQEHATPQEVVAKVREAASTLSNTGDLDQFKQKKRQWVWKDTYVFVQDCDKKVGAANPLFPKDVGHDLASVKDSRIGGRSPERRKIPAKSATSWAQKEPVTWSAQVFMTIS